VSFVVYDVETTGFNKRFDQILQFGAIRADDDLVAIDRIELRSRLLPNVVPSPKALHITGVAFDDIISTTRPSHYQMVCEIQRTLQAWSPAMFLGFNSINFDEEFLRQAFYHGLHPIFLTNTNGNARADVLKLVRAVATLHPNVLTAPRDEAGRLVFRLGKLASTNGMVVGQAHDALADVEITLALCRKARDGAPDLWSTFLRFAAKAAVLDFVRDEEAFAYFEFFGGRQDIHLVTRIGVNPTEANVHYCLDLTADISELRRLSDVELIARLKTYPRPIRKLKVNASPLLCPLWELGPDQLSDFTESDLMREAESVRMDHDFVERLVRAAAAGERVFEPSEHVELQIYGNGFLSDTDSALSRRFHVAAWEQRPGIAAQFEDRRLRRLARRLIYFERPDLLDEAQRQAMNNEISRRVRGGPDEMPWLTIPNAMIELEALIAELEPAFHGPLNTYREHLRARLVQISV
jgi:exodeoxyribonuclease-1